MISAPSGGGKTTVIRRILQRGDERFRYSISATTRKPRANEKNGVDYFFMTEKEFKKRIEHGDFVEWAIVHGNYYGTPKMTLDQWIKEGKIVFLDLDIQGGINVKEKYGNDALLIFIMPPSIQELEQRLRMRNTDDEETLQKRLAAVPKEIDKSRYYDHVVVNVDLEETVNEVMDIIHEFDHSRK